MGNHINPYLFEGEHLVRMVEKDNAPWFVGNDVCRALEIANPRDAMSRLDEDEKGVGNTDTLGGRQDLVIISEAGIYRLVFTSRKPIAERFKRWLAHEVIPAIRRSGSYSADAVPNPASIADEDPVNVRRSLVTEARQSFGCQSARELWFKLKLPTVPSMFADPTQGSLFTYTAIRRDAPAPEGT